MNNAGCISKLPVRRIISMHLLKNDTQVIMFLVITVYSVREPRPNLLTALMTTILKRKLIIVIKKLVKN